MYLLDVLEAEHKIKSEKAGQLRSVHSLVSLCTHSVRSANAVLFLLGTMSPLRSTSCPSSGCGFALSSARAASFCLLARMRTNRRAKMMKTSRQLQTRMAPMPSRYVGAWLWTVSDRNSQPPNENSRGET